MWHHSAGISYSPDGNNPDFTRIPFKIRGVFDIQTNCFVSFRTTIVQSYRNSVWVFIQSFHRPGRNPLDAYGIKIEGAF